MQRIHLTIPKHYRLVRHIRIDFCNDMLRERIYRHLCVQRHPGAFTDIVKKDILRAFRLYYHLLSALVYAAMHFPSM